MNTLGRWQGDCPPVGDKGGLSNTVPFPSSPQLREDIESRGCKREPPQVPHVGAGDSEGERVGEMLQRREAESGLRLASGVPTFPHARPSRCRATDRNNKDISTNCTCLDCWLSEGWGWGPLGPVTLP